MFSNSDDDAEYQKQSIGYSLGLSYRFWYYYGIGSVWSHSWKSYLNPSVMRLTPVFIEESLGVQEKRTVTLYVYRDSRDNSMNPTRGTRVELAVGFTGGTSSEGMTIISSTHRRYRSTIRRSTFHS